MKKLLTGIKPTGDIHIGNYFGAIKPFVDMHKNYDSILFIADLHALNQIHNAETLRSNSLEIAKTYIAAGIDTAKTIIFRQSAVPYTTELSWILNTITPFGLLQRAHAFKDAQAKNTAINAGLFNYPVLMAADILIYDSEIVPVGQDQKQHVEIAQELARIFNNTYGETFVVPKEMISEEVATIAGLDGRKMSKSYNNFIGLFDSEETLQKKVMSIVTDSKGATDPKDPETCNIFKLHRLFSAEVITELTQRYLNGTISYKESKEILLNNIKTVLAPMRNKKIELDENPELVLKILEDGAGRAHDIAHKKIQAVRKAVGI